MTGNPVSSEHARRLIGEGSLWLQPLRTINIDHPNVEWPLEVTVTTPAGEVVAIFNERGGVELKRGSGGLEVSATGLRNAAASGETLGIGPATGVL